MEVAGFYQLVCPMVEARDSGVSRNGGFVGGCLFLLRECFQITPPHPGPHFQPAFPIRPPRDFLQELFRRHRTVAGEDGAGAFLLCDEARANVGGEAGNSIVLPRAEIEIPLPGVSGSMRDKGFEPGESGGACGWEIHARELSRDAAFGKSCLAARADEWQFPANGRFDAR